MSYFKLKGKFLVENGLILNENPEKYQTYTDFGVIFHDFPF